MSDGAGASDAYPAVASEASGGFVVAWQRPMPDGGILARRYDASGAPATGEIAVNSKAPSGQKLPDVATLPGGNFVVVWTDPDTGFYSRRFDAAGQALEGDQQVYASGPWFAPAPPRRQHERLATMPPPLPESYCGNTAVASDAAGNFVVVTNTYDVDYLGYAMSNLYGRRFRASGQPASSPFVVSTYEYGNTNVDVASAAGGNFVVVWPDRMYGTEAVQFTIPKLALLRNAEVSSLDPLTPALATIFPLDPTAPPPAGDRYLTNFLYGDLDPQTDVVQDASHPLVLYQLDQPRTLILVKTADLRLRVYVVE